MQTLTEDQIEFECRMIGLQVAQIMGIPFEKMISKSRRREFVIGRHTAIFIARKKIVVENIFTGNKVKLELIGRALGGLDHSTISVVVNKFQDMLIRGDKWYMAAYNSCIEMLNPSKDFVALIKCCDNMPQLGSPYKYD